MTVILDRHHVDTDVPAALAWAAFAHIEDHNGSDEVWDQSRHRTRVNGVWAYDFFGWVINLAGGSWIDDRHVEADPLDAEHLVIDVNGLHAVTAKTRVKRLLGIDADEYWDLDLGECDLERLHATIETIFGEVAV